MKKFRCTNCGGYSYSSAPLSTQRYPNCICCGASKQFIEEVPLDEVKRLNALSAGLADRAKALDLVDDDDGRYDSDYLSTFDDEFEDEEG